MAKEYNCTVNTHDCILVADELDTDGDLAFTIQEGTTEASIALSKEDAKKLAINIIALLRREGWNDVKDE